MKNITALLLIPIYLTGCTAAQINQGLAIAEPIAAAAAGAAANYYAPGTGALATAAINSIWGAYEQAQAGQPVAQGAVNPAIGQAIESAIPAGTPQATKVAALASAAGIVPIILAKGKHGTATGDRRVPAGAVQLSGLDNHRLEPSAKLTADS